MLAYEPDEDASQRLQQLKPLASALVACGLMYSPSLTYSPKRTPRSANQAIFSETRIQVLAKKDEKTVNYIHAMEKRGLFPPLSVVHDSQLGYTVVADGPIKDFTLIVEFAGDVDYLKKREYDDNNSLMTLITAKDSDKSLVICPDKHANIVRFVNGINNHVRGSKKKVNTRFVKYDVNGEVRTFWVATRDIAKGDMLYLDYNEAEYTYPTHDFI